MQESLDFPADRRPSVLALGSGEVTIGRRADSSVARPDHPPAWYQANSDPVVGRALRLLHNAPADPWTVASLADAVGVSRAALARRFHDLVGEPPMTFLTSWRMALAADLLLEPSAAVGVVARQVGYNSPFTFSTAFKRVHGQSPRAHRQAGHRPAQALR